ncbi:MaoC/PaaZ C-terminal domain-containing protein [Pimelobacter simplex]|uniref:MaoC/PaaZ C-terminal domain-containing protein n=1 Tax=Nocardioides simplex TaxID=2045 RepID=UPI003AAB8C57
MSVPLPTSWAFEDFAAGQVFESQGRTITETDLVTFAGWSWDTNPVHTDAVATSGPDGRFGGPIAHGLLGMSVAMGLASRLGVFEGCSVALLGVDEWRFVAPIRPGDTVRLRLEILGARRTSGGTTGVLDRRFTLVGADDVVVQEGRIGLLVACREPGAAQPS